MPIVLSNAEQERCIAPVEAINAIEEGYGAWAGNDAVRRGTTMTILPTDRAEEFLLFSVMEGGIRAPGLFALRFQPQVGTVTGNVRMYTWQPGYHGGLVFLFRSDNAELVAILNDGYIQHLRVAATAAVGARHLARRDSKVLGIIGSGGMARTFAQCMPAVRPIETIRVWSPTAANLKGFVEEISQKVDCAVEPVDGPEAVCESADILCSCTNSMVPVVRPEWVRPGTHLNSVLFPELGDVYPKVTTAGLLYPHPMVHVGDFSDAGFGIRFGWLTWMGGQADELAAIPSTSPAGEPYPTATYVRALNYDSGESYADRRTDDEITIFSNISYGTYAGDVDSSSGAQGIQFASVGKVIVDAAEKLGLGTRLPLEMFLQDDYTYTPGSWRTQGAANSDARPDGESPTH